VALAALTFVACMTPHTIWLLSQVHGPLQYAQATAGQEGHSEAAMRAFTFALAQCVFPLLAFLALRMALVGPARHRAFFQATLAPLRPSNEPLWLLGMLPVLATVVATLAASTRTASVWGIAIAAGLALLATSRARDAGATLSLPRLWRTLGVVWLSVAVLSPVWWQVRAGMQTPAVSEPREELAQALSRSWREQSKLPLPWISGTRALAASVSFYSSDHPSYWSLWNSAIETPWVKDGKVLSGGGIIVCDESDAPCQGLAEGWSADRRTVRVAKSDRGAHFPARGYVFYLLTPLVSAGVP
jgi:hypothetical protein